MKPHAWSFIRVSFRQLWLATGIRHLTPALGYSGNCPSGNDAWVIADPLRSDPTLLVPNSSMLGSKLLLADAAHLWMRTLISPSARMDHVR